MGATVLPAGTVTFVAADDDRDAAAFESPADAAAAALARQDGRARIALHTGEARLRGDGRYVGAAPRRCQRLRDVANPGQTLLTAATAALLDDALPTGASLRDLGVHRLRDLSYPERVFELRAAEAAGDSPPLRSLDAVPNNLPTHLTTFVGREAELAAVAKLLGGERLVTLTGPGGSGKTRLAARAAAEASDRWRDGVWWVELGAIADPARVAELVAAATGVLVEPALGPLRSLALQLRDRRLLVCLDNCEHVLDAAAQVADALVRGCPEVSVLATSREPLGLPGELVWRVPALTGDEALLLFLERGSQVRPWLTLEASNESVVRAMCARLDGIPLALELAAAWLGTLTPAQIEAGLDDRFALLVRGPRGVPERQQTLAASMAWSHDMLDEIDRVVFRRLAVFAGGFDLDDARAVCAAGTVTADDVLASLGRLVDKSLVVAEDRAGRSRFRLLETVREYADARLREAGETAAARDRHLDRYVALVEELAPQLDRDKDAWRDRIELEQDNLRAALEWGLAAADPGRGRRLAAGLPWLWHLNGRGHEGIAFLRRAIERAPDDRSALQARLLTGVALVADTAGPLDIEYDVAQRALEIAAEHGDDRLRALCLALSAVGRFYTDFDAAWRLALEAQHVAEAAGEAFVVDGARALHGIILHLRDCHDEAQALFEEAVAGLLARGDRGVAATVTGFHATSALCTGDLDRARELGERAVRIAAPLGDYHRVGTTRSVLAMAHAVAGDLASAAELMEPIVRLVDGADGEVFVPGMARVLGTLALWRGDPQAAVRWLEPEARSTDRGADTYLAAQALAPLAAALRELGRHAEAGDAAERALAVGRALGMPRVVADALEQRARLAARDDPEGAIDLHHEALGLRLEHGLRTFYVDSLEALAALMGKADQAARLLAASDTARAALGCPRRGPDRREAEALAARLRSELGDGAFAQEWSAGAAMTLDDAVGYARRSRGSRRRPLAGWASLTPAELEVVRLAAAGYNNPQIGARLFMSRGTVKTHLSHVYAKLGIANRTELARLAGTHLRR